MKKVLLFIFLSLTANHIFAQEQIIDSLKEARRQANFDYTQLYRENSELSYTAPAGEIGAPSGYVINGKLTTTYMVLGARNLPFAFSINPDFTVRVRTDRSAGVRTPSFRLGGTLYLRLTENIEKYKYAQLSFTHHSNGQDGDAVLPDGSINTQTGNFNTNYLTVSYAFGNFTKKANSEKYYSINHKLGLEWHRWFNYEPALIGDYGFTRLNYDFSFRIYKTFNLNNHLTTSNKARYETNQRVEKETWRLNTQFSYAINKLNAYSIVMPKKRLNAELSANYSLPFMQNVFVMATFGYYGEDPYNIYFKDKYAFMRFGLSSTFTRYKVK